MHTKAFYMLAVFALLVICTAAVLCTPSLLQTSYAPVARQPFNNSIQDKVNINVAVSAELETLLGIGSRLAQRIVDYRSEHGAFKAIEELANVKGISAATVEAITDKICIE